MQSMYGLQKVAAFAHDKKVLHAWRPDRRAPFVLADDERWTVGRAMLFAGGISGLFWALFAALVYWVLW